MKFNGTIGRRATQLVGAFTLTVLASTMSVSAAGLVPVEETKRRCDLSGSMALTTDYVFRGLSLSDEGPAIQGSVDLTCGIFYAGIWASNLDTAESSPNIEIDYYAGVTPSLAGIDFDFGLLYYTFPGRSDVVLGEDNDYLEVKAGASKTFADKLTLGVTYYHAFYDGSLGLEDSNTVEGSVSYSLPKVSIFSPSISGGVGWEEQDITGGGSVDYTYWNVGISGDFHERWTLDVRYWDTNEGLGLGDIEEERVVGTISASF